jgi:hypothetical protein
MHGFFLSDPLSSRRRELDEGIGNSIQRAGVITGKLAANPFVTCPAPSLFTTSSDLAYCIESFFPMDSKFH